MSDCVPITWMYTFHWQMYHNPLRLCSFCYLLDQLQHPLVMRAFPVDLPAGRADVEFIKVLPGQRLQTVEDSFLANRFEGMVATHATMKRGDAVFKLKALNHFSQLLQRVE